MSKDLLRRHRDQMQKMKLRNMSFKDKDKCSKQNCRAEFGRLNLKKDAYFWFLSESSMKSQQWDATGGVQV